MQSESVGQLEFTCLPPGRDTKLTAWVYVVWQAGHVVIAGRLYRSVRCFSRRPAVFFPYELRSDQ